MEMEILQQILHKVTVIEQEVSHLKEEIVGIKEEIPGIKEEVSHLKEEVVGIKREIVGINTRLDKIELSLSQNTEVTTDIFAQVSVLTDMCNDHDRKFQRIKAAI